MCSCKKSFRCLCSHHIIQPSTMSQSCGVCLFCFLLLHLIVSTTDLQVLPEWSGDERVSSSASSTTPTFSSQPVGYVFASDTYTLCAPGCDSCSNGVCSWCVSGYALSENQCIFCGINCHSCSVNEGCYNCVEGAFLNGESCDPCDVSCASCNGAATNCTNCRSGFYRNGNDCQACPRNCKSCNSATTCSECMTGFTTNSNATQCIGCGKSCGSCQSGNILTCTGCGTNSSLYLSSNGECKLCTDTNCRECSQNYCAKCKRGYHNDTLGSCVLNCRLPCLSCQSNQPTVCTACFSGAILTSQNKCVMDTSLCGGSTPCLQCPTATNYYLNSNSTCQVCPSLPNCLQCDNSSINTCQLCQLGYYLSSDYLCQLCPVGCHSCISSSICDTCERGYTLPVVVGTGICHPCNSPCLTCYNGVNLCLQCMLGYTKVGWKCQNDIFLRFTVTFQSGTISQINQIINQFVERVLEVMEQNTVNTDMVTIQTMATGSVVITGTYDEGTATTSQTVTDGATKLVAGLTSSTIEGFVVESVSVNESEGSSSSETVGGGGGGGMIIFVGAAIGGVVILTIVMVFVVKKCKRWLKVRKRTSWKYDPAQILSFQV